MRNKCDHITGIVNMGISEKTTKRQKFDRTRTIKNTAINDFREVFSAIDISSLLKANLSTDPIIDYEKFEKKSSPRFMINIFQRNVWNLIVINTSLQNESNWVYSSRSNSETNYMNVLTHWGRDKMDAISQTTFWSAFSWMKTFEFRLKFHWSLFPRVQLTIFQHWLR